MSGEHGGAVRPFVAPARPPMQSKVADLALRPTPLAITYALPRALRPGVLDDLGHRGRQLGQLRLAGEPLLGDDRARHVELHVLHLGVHLLGAERRPAVAAERDADALVVLRREAAQVGDCLLYTSPSPRDS